MKQIIARVEAEYYDDLAEQIQDEIDHFYQEKYSLVHIHYCDKEKYDDGCHAFLLFNEITKSEDDCYGQEMDTRCDKAQRCSKRDFRR